MTDISGKILSRVKALPDSPGVYMILDPGKKIIYVGKARKLKKRVQTYFRRGRARDSRLEMLVSEVWDIKVLKA